MRTLTKKVSERIYSINAYDYKAYIYFMLVLLFCVTEYVITQVMVNCYGYVKGPFYERSLELIFLSTLFTLVKEIFSCMLDKALVDNPIEKEFVIELPPICTIKGSNIRQILTYPVLGMIFYFWGVELYNMINYLMCICQVKNGPFYN